MKKTDIIMIAFRNVTANMKKSILLSLSIIIGVVSVIIVSFIGTSGGRYVEKEMQKLGLQGISIYQSKENTSKPLYKEDAELLERRFKEIETAMPVVIDFAGYKMNKISSEAIFFGVGERADEVYNVKVIHGRAPDKKEIMYGANVAVVDDELAIKTYRRTNVVGKEIVIKISDTTQNFRIIGVIKSQKDGINNFLGNNMPDFIYIPYTTLNNMRKSDELSQISIKCISAYDSNGAEFAQYLSKSKNSKNGYIAENVSNTMNQAKIIINIITTVLSTVAAISLCVAGLGIMNSMFSNGIERRREIGVCIALGATEKDIITEFVCEAAIISIFGGLVGALISFMIIKVLSLVFSIDFFIDINIFFITELICIIASVLFSIIPAKQAASLDPVKALRRTS